MVDKLFKKLSKKVGFLIGIFTLIFISGFPFVVMFFSSLKTERQQYTFPPRLIPEGGIAELTLENYINVLNPEIFPFFRFFGNSFLVASISAFVAVFLAIFGAYSFARLRYSGRKFLQRSIILVYMFGGILLIVPLYQIVVSVNLANTHFALILVYLMQVLPVSLYMLGNYFRSVPYEIEEAAIIDGCSRIGAIFRVVIPLSKPAIIAVYIYAFMISWNEYLFASIFLRSPSLHTLPIGLEQLFYTEHFVWGRMMAASILTALPIIILFLGVEKYMTEGLTAGSLK